MKKFVALLLLCTMVLTACGSKTENNKNPENPSTSGTEDNGAAEGIYKAGTYEGSAEGFGGTLTVSVKVSADKIESVEVTSHGETEGIGTKAIDELPGKIAENNSADVDVVAGATISSKAIISAVKDALKEFTADGTETAAVADGVYTGESTGYQGPLKLEVTIADEKITDIKIVENVETVGIGTKALAAVPERIIENQSVAVDALSGATASSKAVLAAVTNALENAGADLSKYSVKPVVEKGEDQVIDADVVIVGAGGAGLTAAIEAKIQGAASVVLLEKMDITGGNTRMSGGEFAAPGNWVQLAEGITDDSVEKYYNDILKGGYNLGDPALVRIIAENALPVAEWLRDYVGIKFRDHQSWYGGHEVARTLWPEGDGPAYVDKLEEKARELGVEIYFQTEATDLIMADGRAAGVKAVHKNGANYTFNAKNGVIITTGGFGRNVEMRQEYNTMWPTLDENVPSTNSPAITGDGIRMGLAVGANTVGMDKIQLYPVNNPATGNYYYIDYARLNSTALLVNKEGERFVNEKGTRDVISAATLEQTDSMVYEIVDAGVVAEQKLYEDYAAEIEQCQKTGVLAIGTIDEVCEHFGVPADAVKATIERYNGLVESGEDTDFGRTDNFNKIGDGPYFMFSSVVSVHHTMGGLQIDTEARVIDTDGNPIPGLYAAGEVTGGIHGGNRLGSVAVPDTAIFGQIAAKSCVAGK